MDRYVESRPTDIAGPLASVSFELYECAYSILITPCLSPFSIRFSRRFLLMMGPRKYIFDALFSNDQAMMFKSHQIVGIVGLHWLHI